MPAKQRLTIKPLTQTPLQVLELLALKSAITCPIGVEKLMAIKVPNMRVIVPFVK